MSNLKEKNNKSIFYILSAAILCVLVVQFGFADSSKWVEFILAGTLTPILSVVLVMLTNFISHDFKHKLIFTRLRNEMPASRCHTLCKKDPRIDLSDVSARWPRVFSESTSAENRNSYWYNDIYKGVRGRPEVLQIHGNFLLYRDAFSGLLGIFLLVISWNIFAPLNFMGSINTWVYLVLGSFICITMVTARNSGNRFVTNAIAAAI